MLYSDKGCFSEVAGSKDYTARIKGVLLLNESTEWFGTVLDRIKAVSATLSLGRVAA